MGEEGIPVSVVEKRPRSDFFKAACNGSFKEAEEGILKLPEQGPETFRHFVHWLYTGELGDYFYPSSAKPTFQSLEAEVLKNENLQKRLKKNTKREVLRWRYSARGSYEAANMALDCAMLQDAPLVPLISLYILADQLQIRGLKDNVITTILNVYGHCKLFWNLTTNDKRPSWLASPATGINLAWAHLPEGSQLRVLLVKLFCYHAQSFSGCGGPYDASFLTEAFVMLHARMDADENIVEKWTKKEEICKYHIHDVACALEEDSA